MPYHIAIDIFKFKHNCFIATKINVNVKDFIFINDKAEFNLLLEELKQLGDPTKIKVGIKSTGHYGNNLKHCLVQSGYTFMEFNPYLTFFKMTDVPIPPPIHKLANPILYDSFLNILCSNVTIIRLPDAPTG